MDRKFDVVPDGAAWLTQDANGAWWAFEVEPFPYEQGWYENEIGRSKKLCVAAPNPHWSTSLYRVSVGRP